MTDTLDLAPLDVGLERLLQATSGNRLAPDFIRAGEELAQSWSEHVVSAGLVRTGAYAGSLAARAERVGAGSALIKVETDLGYPSVLEYGDAYIAPRRVGLITYQSDQDRLLGQLAADIAAAVEAT